MLEERVKTVQTAKSDSVIEKYNIELLSDFIRDKFGDLNKTYEKSSLGEKRVLLSSIFPAGLLWQYPGISNSKKSPLYRLVLAPNEKSIACGAAGGNRTHTPLREQDFESSASTSSATAAHQLPYQSEHVFPRHSYKPDGSA